MRSSSARGDARAIGFPRPRLLGAAPVSNIRAMRIILSTLIALSVFACGPKSKTEGEPSTAKTRCELDKSTCGGPEANIRCELLYPCDGHIICYRCNERNYCYECGHALRAETQPPTL